MWRALGIVVMDEESDDSFVHGVGFGKGQGATHQAR
jgi:hypothetical protein